MIEEPRFEDDLETVILVADVHGHPVRIEIPREAIEDQTGAESMTPDKRLDFVKRNRHQIIANVAAYTRSARDLTGIRITEDQLKLCD